MAAEPKIEIWTRVRDKDGRIHDTGIANGVARRRCGGLQPTDKPTSLGASVIDPWCDVCRKMIRKVTWSVANLKAEPAQSSP